MESGNQPLWNILCPSYLKGFSLSSEQYIALRIYYIPEKTQGKENCVVGDNINMIMTLALSSPLTKQEWFLALRANPNTFEMQVETVFSVLDSFWFFYPIAHDHAILTAIHYL